MPEQCDICKVEAAPEEEFAIEGLGSRKKRYCPRCRERHTNKVRLAMLALSAGFGVLGGVGAVVRDQKWLDSQAVCFALFFLLSVHQHFSARTGTRRYGQMARV